MKELIQKLVETVGPSGYEDGVRELIRAKSPGWPMKCAWMPWAT